MWLTSGAIVQSSIEVIEPSVCLSNSDLISGFASKPFNHDKIYLLSNHDSWEQESSSVSCQELKLTRRAKRQMTRNDLLRPEELWSRPGGHPTQPRPRLRLPVVYVQTLIRFYAVDVQQTPPQSSRYWSVYREGVFMTDINRLVHSSVCCNAVVIAGNIYKDKSERFHVYNLTFLFPFLSSNLGVAHPAVTRVLHSP